MHTNSLTALPIRQLKRAIAIRERIDVLTHELNGLIGGTGQRMAAANGNGNGHRGGGVKGNGLSLAGRERIAAAQRLRWSRYNSGRGGNRISAKAEANGSRLSAAGRAKVSAAVKARWERYRAAKKRNK